MTYNIQIQCCALAILILFAIEYFIRKRERSRSNDAFLKLLLFAILLTFDDICCIIALTTPGCLHVVRVIAGKAYLILMYWAILSLLEFTISLADEKRNRKTFKIRYYHICFAVGVVLSVLSIVLPLSYVSEDTYVYIYGPCQTLCYLFGAVIVVYIFVFLLVYRKLIPLNQKIPIYLYVVIQGVIVLIQKIEPRILLTSFGLAIVIGLILFTLKNPYVMELEEKNNKIRGIYDKTIKALVDSVDAKDRYTSGHSQRVAQYSMEIAKRMGKSEEEQLKIYKAGLMHDIGKIRVPESIINKNGKLTDEEYSIIKVHTECGGRILSQVFDDEDFFFASKYHHERYDGKGYPNGLSGEIIPEVARIVGVADSYDAMTSNRSYRDLLPQDVAREEIRKNRGTQFDPQIADIMLSMIDEDSEYDMCEKTPKIKYILVAGDEYDAKFVIDAFKHDEGYEILCADRIETIEKLINIHKIRVILIDLYKGNGMSLYNEITKRYSIPVIVVSEARTAQAIRAMVSTNVDDYLAKPVNPILLRESIHSVIYLDD